MGKIDWNNKNVKQKKTQRRRQRAGSAAACPVAGICDLSRHDHHLSLLYIVALLFRVAVDRCPCATLAAPLVLHGSTKKPKLNSICISMQTGQDKGDKE
jgi:ribosomal protein L32